MKKDCQIYFLEMTKRPSYPDKSEKFVVEEVKKPINPEFFLDLYKRVGSHYNWTDRLVYSHEELKTIINQDKTRIYLLKVDGITTGFSELTVEDSHVEILFFGLFPEAIGKGWGKAFLELMIDKAWTFNPPKVQLNTCDWDHPRALRNYLSAGFKEVRRIVKNP